MALLGEGEHEAILFADSQEIDRSTFEVTRLSTGEFLRDEAKLAIAYNFPEYGKELWLEWTESAQNFLITRELDTPDPLDVAGIWYDRSSGTILSLAAERRYVNRQEIYAVSTNVDPNSDSLGGVYEGYVIGDTGQVSSVLPEGLVLNATLRFSSTSRYSLLYPCPEPYLRGHAASPRPAQTRKSDAPKKDSHIGEDL